MSRLQDQNPIWIFRHGRCQETGELVSTEFGNGRIEQLAVSSCCSTDRTIEQRVTGLA